MDRGLSMKRNPSIYSSTRLCLSPSRVRSQTRMPKIDGCRGANPEIHFFCRLHSFKNEHKCKDGILCLNY